MGQDRQLAWKRVGDVFVVVDGVGKPEPSEWQELISDFSEFLEQGTLRVLVASEGGAPDATQRKLLSDTIRGRPARFALLAKSAGVRAAGMAVSFFVPGFSVFKVTDVEKALSHLDVRSATHEELRQALSEVRRQVRGTERRPSVLGT
jgi:hypothetical protein